MHRHEDPNRRHLNSFLNDLEKETQEFDILAKLANAPGLLYGMDKLINRDKIEALMEDKIKEQMDPTFNEQIFDNSFTQNVNNNETMEPMEQNEPTIYKQPININPQHTETKNPISYINNTKPIPYPPQRANISPHMPTNGFLPKNNDLSNNYRQSNFEEYKRMKKRKKRRQTQILNEKVTLLTYLDRLKRKGVIIQTLDINSNFEEIKLEALKHRRRRKIEFGKHIFIQILLDIIKIIELISTKIEMVDLHLKGWHRNVQYHLNEYDDIIEDIVEKYTGTDDDEGSSMPPEAKLGLLLLVSAIEHAASNSSVGSNIGSIKQLFTSSTPPSTPTQSNFDDELDDESILAEIEKERNNS